MILIVSSKKISLEEHLNFEGKGRKKSKLGRSGTARILPLLAPMGYPIGSKMSKILSVPNVHFWTLYVFLSYEKIIRLAT